MPINNPRGWRIKADASKHREAQKQQRAALRAERARMVYAVNGVVEPPSPPIPIEAPPQAPDPNELTAKQLREALAGRGLSPPISAAKARLVEIYNQTMPKPPPPPPPPPNTIPAAPKEDSSK